MAVRLAALAAALALLTTAAWAQSPPPSPSDGSCEFVSERPRYELVWALVRVTASTGGTLLSDAVLRTLREELGLADCQVSMNTASVCDAGAADLACASPTYACAGYALSSSAYMAVASGECGSDSDVTSPAAAPAASADESALCSQVATAAREAVLDGTCRAACGAVSLLAPPPPPRSASATPSPTPSPSPAATATYADCAQFVVTVSVETEADASDVSEALTGGTMRAALVGGVAAFATLNTEVHVFVTGTDVMTGFGSFPPPPPPSPPCVSRGEGNPGKKRGGRRGPRRGNEPGDGGLGRGEGMGAERRREDARGGA